jgi:Ni,Fe-hydrogenase III large subunit
VTEFPPPIRSSIIDELERSIPGLLLERQSDDVLAAVLPQRELEGAVRLLGTDSARLADLHATPDGAQLRLRLSYALDTERRYLLLSSPLDADEYPPLAEITAAAFVEQCEAFELFGIHPRDALPLDRSLMAPLLESEFRLRARSSESPSSRAPHYVEGEAIEFPFGPVRVAGWESLYMGLVTTGEEILDLYLFQWHKHRGIERQLCGRTPEQAVFLVQRLEGLSAVGNCIAFCRAVEAAAGVSVGAPAAASRAVALELERIYNHTAAIAALCQTTGLSVGQANAEIVLENLLRLNLAAFGHRYLFETIELGGVRQAPDREAVRTLLPTICNDLSRVVAALFATNSYVDRLEACGLVSEERARRLGLVGPLARASGVDLDGRRDHPWAPYSELKINVASRFEGDAFARMHVFVDEIRESQRLIGELLDACGDGRVELSARGGCGFGWAESPRGEALAWLSLDDEGRVEWARLRPASVRNWRAFDDAARSRNVFTDVPIIEASFWLTVAGFAR